MNNTEYYDRLGVSKDASQDEIKRAYRKMSKKYHPDINKEPGAEEKYKEVQEAYETLSDDQKRAAYDQYGPDGANAGFGGQGGFFVMTTQGQGTLLANAYGSIKKIELNNQEVTIDNAHVVAWSQTLDYNIHLENGFWQSIGTGEGVVNTFRGTGEIYVQSLNLQTFAGLLNRYLPKRS